MSIYVKITFGSEHLSINRKPLDEAIEDHITLFKDGLIVKGIDPEKLSDLAYEKQRESVESIRETEKSILTQLLQNALNDDKKVSTLLEISDTIDMIENSDDHIIIPKTEVERINKSYQKIQDIPFGWLKLSNLFKQIENPKEVEIEEKQKEMADAGT